MRAAPDAGFSSEGPAPPGLSLIHICLALAPYQRAMVNTPSILLYSTAFLQCVAEEKGEEGLNSLLDRKWAVPAVDRMLQAAGGKAMNLLDRLVENAQNGHAALTGQPMDEPVSYTHLCRWKRRCRYHRATHARPRVRPAPW